MAFQDSIPQQIIWVSPDGDDNNSGAEDAPLASIQLAIDRATPGTAILLKPGDYSGNFEFEAIEGTEDKPIWLAAAEGPGSVTITAVSNTESVITIQGEDNLIIQDLVLVGGYDGIEVNQSGKDFTDLVNNIVISGNTIIGAVNDGIKVGQATNAVIVNNFIDGAGDQGIDVLGSVGVVIDGNEITNVTGSSGLFVKGGSSDVVVSNNYIHDVAGDGLLVGGWSSADVFLPGTDYEAKDVEVFGNVVHDAVKRPLTIRGAENVDIHDNYFGSLESNDFLVLVGTGSPELSPPPPSEYVQIHDNVFDRSENFVDLQEGSSDIFVFDNAMDGVVDGDIRPFPPEPIEGGFVDSLPQALLDAPLWPTSARSTSTIAAGSGSQTLVGTDGHDFLSGGGGDDITIGGRGDDVHSIGSSRDLAFENADEGIDTAIAYVQSYVLPDNIENLTVAYWQGGTYSGNDLNNIIQGGAGHDILGGGGGDDLFVPLNGNDTIADFAPGALSGDRIDLRDRPELADFETVLNRSGQDGADTVIDLGDNDSFRLSNVNLTDLTADDFLFAIGVAAENAPPTEIILIGGSTAEGSPPGTIVATLDALDPDDPAEALTFALTDDAVGRFAVVGSTIVVAGQLDYELATKHTITVQVSDPTGNTFETDFELAVTNVGPTAPVDADVAADEVAEGAATGTFVGITALSQEVDGGAVRYFLLNDADGRFAIDETTGLVTVANGSLIDFETAEEHSILVAAIDRAGAINVEQFTIAVTNVDGVQIVGTSGNDLVDQSSSVAGQPLPTSEDDVILGKAGNDYLSGLAGDDLISGGAGADALSGGPGIDTASYAGASSGIKVSLTTGSGSAGDAAGDLIWGIENVIGTSFGDTIEGDASDNVLVGGDGIDKLSYENATAGVTVKLCIAGPQDTVGAGIDTISGFEYLFGSQYDDRLAGNQYDNVLKGFDGDDCLYGDAGDDILAGGFGNDRLAGGAGNDGFILFSPDEGFDQICDFVSGSDWIRVSAASFGGGLTAGSSVNLVTATDLAFASWDDADGYFILDNEGEAAGTVYWDETGGSSEDAVALLELLGGASLMATDFVVV